MLAGLTGIHLLVIVGAVLLLFGATKLPVFAKGLGQSVKILRSELSPAATAAPVAAPVAVPVVVETPTRTAS